MKGKNLQARQHAPNDATTTPNANMDGDLEDPGDVFRIPDLWASSTCLNLGPDYSSHLFAELKLDGLCASNN